MKENIKSAKDKRSANNAVLNLRSEHRMIIL